MKTKTTNVKKWNFSLAHPYGPIVWLISLPFLIFNKIEFIKTNITPILKVVNKLFINSHVATFLAIWYPMIFIGILPNAGAPQFMVYNIASLIPVIIGVQVMPIIMITLKNSSILKRIGATETKTWHITASFVFYFTIVSILSTMFNMGMGMVFYQSKIDFSIVNMAQVFFAVVVGTIIGMSFGILLSGIIKNQQTALVVGILLTVPGAFLTGQFLPPNLVNDWGPVKYISFIFPQKVATVFTQVSVNDASIFDISSHQGQDFQSIGNMIDMIKSGLITNISGIGNVSASMSSNELSKILVDSKIFEFELTTQTEIIMAWTLAALYPASMMILTSYTFNWGVR